MTRSLRIYLAGASAEVSTCETYRDRLRASGVTITHDWMADVRANAQAGLPDHAIPAEERARYAHADLTAVAEADVFWMIVPTNASIGAWVELGFALGQRHPPLIMTSGVWRSIFQDVRIIKHHEGHEDAFAHVQRVAARTAEPRTW